MRTGRDSKQTDLSLLDFSNACEISRSSSSFLYFRLSGSSFPCHLSSGALCFSSLHLDKKNKIKLRV